MGLKTLTLMYGPEEVGSRASYYYPTSGPRTIWYVFYVILRKIGRTTDHLTGLRLI